MIPGGASRIPDRLTRAIVEWLEGNAVEGIFTTDESLRILSWNGWLVTATGVAVTDAVGRPLLEVFPSLVERGLDQHYTEALAGHVQMLSHTLHRFILPAPMAGQPQEQMLQTGRIAPLRDEDRIVGTITIVNDVSERVARERELRAQIATAEAARAAAENASRVKDDFLATLSHEIRTPLNAVLGWTHTLRSRAELDMATVRRAAEVIERNASTQLTLVTDMLDMARMAAGKVRLELVKVDLAALALAAVDVIGPSADAKGVRVITDFEVALPPVGADPDRLLQVFGNLLANAVKFSEAGGVITVAVATETDGVRVSVSDTGRGIAAPFLNHVFERFTQADPSSSRRHGGLGLGLALVKELVELHGGTVDVKSDGVGRGAVFTVHLPAREETARAAAAPPLPARPMERLDSVRVLVVEDDPDALEIAARTITDAGAAVVTATSAAHAMSLMRGEVKPHVIVTDIGMPGDDGFALLEALRKLPGDSGGLTPAIAVTAYGAPADRERALAAGFHAHLVKPFSARRLVAAIAKAASISSTKP